MITISKTIGLDAGHRIPNHESKCKYFHGHRYTVTAVAGGEVVQEVGDSQEGMVLDFGFLKESMMRVIHDPYDHRFILHKDDPTTLVGFDDMGFVYVPCIPTAENLAEMWFHMLAAEIRLMQSAGRVPHTVELVRLEVQETPTSVAVYEP